KALELAQKALDIQRAVLGEEHPDTAVTYGNLGSTYDSLGNHAKALELTQRSLDIRRSVLGEEHPDTALAYGNLGSTYYSLGKYDKALELEQKSFLNLKTCLGISHQSTRNAAINLAMTLGKLNCVPEAKAVLKEAVQDLPVSDPFFKEAAGVAKSLDRKKKPHGPRFTPPKRRKKRR
ncbi:MAG: tetratricopeptide repeat-containing protein, partial [Verrucomicrobiae bacterium]|nr:tetratricopeptide repeat-containing protein [Verrucomicrobiae bacterium]